MAALESRGDKNQIRGIICKDGGQIVSTPDADPVDVEALPLPARHLVDLHRYRASMAERPLTPVVTSRGCPSACHFCSSSSFFGRGWRYRSAESVLYELDEVYNRYGFRAVAFMDDNFTLAPKRVEQIADGIMERGYDLKWWNLSRVDTIVSHPGMVARMAAAGSTTVYLGIESGSDETLNSLGKNTKSSDVIRAVEILRQNGIESYGSYIIGNLNENVADVEKTIDLAIRLDTNIAQFSILTPVSRHEAVRTDQGTHLLPALEVLRWAAPGVSPSPDQPALSANPSDQGLCQVLSQVSRSDTGFKQAAGRYKLSFRNMAACVWELVFEFHLRWMR